LTLGHPGCINLKTLQRGLKGELNMGEQNKTVPISQGFLEKIRDYCEVL
jgi:hypothetical protein